MFANSPIKKAAQRFWQRIFQTRAEDTLPHIVTHQRVYIVPTKRGLAFVVALLLMLIASVNYGLSLGYALCFILTGLFAATLLHTYRNMAGISIEKIVQSNTFAGTNACFSISLANTLKDTRHGIQLSTKQGSQVMTHVHSNVTIDRVLTVPTHERGVIHLGRVTLQSDWPLGLWTCWSYVHAPVKSLVFPKPESNPPPMPPATLKEGSGRATVGIEGEVSDLKPYRAGDSKGSIAWKSAAKGMGMYVRTFESHHAPSDTVLSLENTGHYQIEEQLSRLCAWVLDAKSAKIEFALRLPGETLDADGGEIHCNNALKVLALYGLQR